MGKQSLWLRCVVLFCLSAIALVVAEQASAQEPVGVVTALQGTARLTRPTVPTPVFLRFKDGLLIRDIVDTQEKSLVRILFGGKSTVTVRELSRLEVREETLPTGATLSVHELSKGAILVNVARQLLRPDDEVQIRTPNAVAAVRGTTISAECRLTSAQCIFTVLAGSALITPRGGTPFTLNRHTAVTVIGTPPTGIQIGAMQAIAPAQASQVMRQYEVRLTVKEAASQQQAGQAQLQTATQLAAAVAGAIAGEASPSPTQTETPAATAPSAAIMPPAVPEAIPSPPPPPPVSPLEPPPEPPPVPAPTPSRIALSGTNLSTTPLLQVTASFTLPAPDSLFEVPSGASATIAGPLLNAVDTTMVLGAHALLVGGSLTSTTTTPLFRIEPGTITLGGSLVLVQSGGVMNASGPLGALHNSILTTPGGPLVLVEAGGSLNVAIADASPLLSLKSSVVASAASLFDLKGSQLALTGPVVALSQQSALANSSGPVISLDGGLLLADTLVRTDGTGNQLILTGSLLDLSHATVVLRKLLDVPTGSSNAVIHALAAGEPLIRLVDSSLTLTGPGAGLTRFGGDSGVTETQTGIGLMASGSVLAIDGALLGLNGVALVDAAPQLQLTGTIVTQTGSESLIDVKGLPVAVTGALLAATESSITTTASFLRVQNTALTAGGTGSITPAEGGTPLLQFDQSAVLAADFFATISGALTLGSPFVRATSSVLISGADFVTLGPGSTLTSTTSQPLMQLTDSSLTGFTLMFNDGGIVNLLGGPLLNAVNSQLAFDFAVVESEFGGQIISTSSAPLLALNGGTLTSNGHLFVLSGNAVAQPPGLTRPLQAAGTLFEATNGASVAVAGNALRLDTALLEATAPILSLIGSSTAPTSLSTGSSTMDLFKSSVTSTGPVVALDKGLINVQNGPLINLASGSSLVVIGDLLQLLNGSKINVLNGPLVLVTGSGSLLNVSGALVSFGGAGGNVIVVNNNVAPTATLSGLPVSATTGGSITIGPNPVKNPTLGSITVTTGSLIQATGGGIVAIAAQ
jgi:hypothetical protein